MTEIKHAEGEGWLSFYFECAICGHKQAHVIPLPCANTECAKCGAQTEIPFPDEGEDT